MIATIGYSTITQSTKYNKHLLDTCGLPANKVSIITIENPGKYSLTEAYNQILDKSETDIVVLIHDDLRFMEKKWLKKIVDIFNETDYGVIGVAGTTFITDSGKWWDNRDAMLGRVWHEMENPKTKKLIKYESKYSGKFSQVLESCMVDGLFIAIHKDRIKGNFDETIKGFHFYDLDFSFSQHLKGVKVGVTTNIKVLHESIGNIYDDKGNLNETWENNRKQFIEKFKDNLPCKISPDVIFEEKSIIHSKHPDIAIIITLDKDFNQDELISCLDSIITCSYSPNLKIYIGHVNEEKKCMDILEQYVETLEDFTYELINLEFYNFAKNNNQIVKTVTEDLILFVNPKLTFKNDVIGYMLKQYYKDKNAGTIGCRIHYGDGYLHNVGIDLIIKRRFDKEDNKYKDNLYISHMGIKSSYKYDLNNIRSTYGVSEYCLMIKKDVFKQIGGFDENLLESFYGLKLGVGCKTINKNNYIISDAVCIYGDLEKDITDNTQKDFSENIIPYVNTNKKLKNNIKIYSF